MDFLDTLARWEAGEIELTGHVKIDFIRELRSQLIKDMSDWKSKYCVLAEGYDELRKENNLLMAKLNKISEVLNLSNEFKRGIKCLAK